VPRELGDVLHYFLDESGEAPEGEARASIEDRALPTIGVLLGERDVVRAAFVWNVAVEVARTGAAAKVIAARGTDAEALWPASGAGPLGAELVLCGARDLAELERTARDVAALRGRGATKPGLVLVCVPAAWIARGDDSGAIPRWTLLFATPDPRELRASYALAERLLRAAPDARVGVTIHGVASIAEARSTFQRLASEAERNLGRGLLSYGLLLDDLSIYRAIVSLRPIGLAQPQSRGARAVADVARLLLEDAPSLGAKGSTGDG
jgi:hypothetical protein